MLSPIEELKIQSKKLLKSIRTDTSEPQVKSFQKYISGKKSGNPIQLKHCQNYIAQHYGFDDWLHARRVLECENQQLLQDYGTFWYSSRCSSLLNHWCNTYREALELLNQHGGFLLPYKNQFIVVENNFLEALGMPGCEELWHALANNWCQGDSDIRRQLAFKRVSVKRTQ
ncbi:hypothetical protein [Aliikangiella sp. G2MR2-5]|uniref:hypothetical protein n=1 Tax=Aliikangiella sp. G2MR2-5 TaxID=2788943 RepID=UPI0018A8F828|nr:hypothetical protein [Aliikangiella sp. G2MR2-5]